MTLYKKIHKFLVRIIILNLSIITLSVYASTDLTGAGGTFPAPVYTKWAVEYQQLTGSRINYQAIGSSGGVKQIIAKNIDFGASDVPMKDSLLNKNGLFQFPTVIGGVVLAVNIPGIEIGQLILDGKIVGDIYLGVIKKWNDPAITKLNPNLTLPNTNINVIHRADGSGTTSVFTNYLCKVNKEWNDKVGKGNIVNWPTGLGGKGNDGVAAFVQRLSGSIGYVEYTYVKQNNLNYTQLIGANGKAVIPNAITFANATKNIQWKKSFTKDLTFQKGNNVWPIVSTTFILIYKNQMDIDKGTEILKFFDWAYKNGREIATSLHYVNLPENVISLIRTAWKANIKDRFGNAILK
ncbi:phosphate ABC transporter substrate-binding protein PstS [Pantoea sp. Aalb]|uniref:phosphate ABC transporter substrate-binding protein PstS n=1 Tax=Pantoea sp. Aalb TaxID=2576762 RepID=UPI0013227D8F|nr:phosphate ABC transporter substrate-binding protein PstS [Pantoea sp. Aalb]MXP67623.1 phosphate ABC transporter substrate-binding protein PstS [Pantoea sp. Aalb]